MKRYKLVNKRRFYSFILISTLVFSLSFLSSFDRVKVQGQGMDIYETITVQYGDTIWDIASKYNYENKDPRKFVYELKNLNKITNDIIHPDQIIRVPKAN